MKHKIEHELNGLSAQDAAKRLLGCELIRSSPQGNIRVRITETEAYDETDAASHSYNGRTPRTDVMFGPPGRLYVYFTYGLHYCCNVVVGEVGNGAAVLLRAAVPIEGIELMQARRKKHGVELSNGPAKLCQALDIDMQLNGHDLASQPLQLTFNTPVQDAAIVATTRIGISRARDKLWRYYIKGI